MKAHINNTIHFSKFIKRSHTKIVFLDTYKRSKYVLTWKFQVHGTSWQHCILPVFCSSVYLVILCDCIGLCRLNGKNKANHFYFLNLVRCALRNFVELLYWKLFQYFLHLFLDTLPPVLCVRKRHFLFVHSIERFAIHLIIFPFWNRLVAGLLIEVSIGEP